MEKYKTEFKLQVVNSFVAGSSAAGFGERALRVAKLCDHTRLEIWLKALLWSSRESADNRISSLSNWLLRLKTP